MAEPGSPDYLLDERLKKELGTDQLEAGAPDLSPIEAEKKRTSDLLNILSGDSGNKTEHVIAAAESLGEGGLAEALRGGVGGGRGHSNETFGAARDKLIGVANRRLKDIADRELDLRKRELKFQEEQYGRDVLRLEPKLGAAIDQRLATMLSDLGYKADTAREQLGGALADRGISRSSFGAGQVQKIYQGEQASKTQEQLESTQQKEAVSRSVSDVFKNIREAQKGRKLAQNLSELSAASEFVFQLDYADTERQIQDHIAALDDGTGGGLLAGSIAGTILGGVAGAFIGGPYGAAIGASAGGQIGGGVGGGVS